jgi:hypothetical protein
MVDYKVMVCPITLLRCCSSNCVVDYEKGYVLCDLKIKKRRY